MNRKKIADSLDNGPLAFLVQGLILVYLVSLSLETVPSLNAYAGTFKTIDTIITAVFVVELVLRLIVIEKPLKYLTSFYGVVDLVAILPALVGADTKSLRALRLLRLFKMFKNKEINAALTRMQLAFHEIKRDLTILHLLHSFLPTFPQLAFITLKMKPNPKRSVLFPQLSGGQL